MRDARTTTMTATRGTLEARIYNGKCISAPAHIHAEGKAATKNVLKTSNWIAGVTGVDAAEF